MDEIMVAYHKLKGKAEVGDVVMHPDYKLTMDLVSIEKDMGICKVKGITYLLPLSELANVNKVRDRAMIVKLFGEDSDDMEGTFLQ